MRSKVRADCILEEYFLNLSVFPNRLLLGSYENKLCETGVGDWKWHGVWGKRCTAAERVLRFEEDPFFFALWRGTLAGQLRQGMALMSVL